jgi:lipopolysaccharide transport system ATP-binding protein
MYVRLAFAVAAFLEPEILIIDEVLAVGDAEFQKKCLGRMKDVSVNDGRTVLFVSHNMAAMQKLCTTGMLLQHGQLISTGPMKNVIDQYLIHGFTNTNERTFEVDESKVASIIKVQLTDEDGNAIFEAPIGKKWIVKLYFQINKPVDNFISAIGMVNSFEVSINTSWQEPMSFQPGVYCSEFKLNEIVYATGNYRIAVGLSFDGLQVIQYIEDAIDLNVVPIVEDIDETVVISNTSAGIVLNQLLMRTYKV